MSYASLEQGFTNFKIGIRKRLGFSEKVVKKDVQKQLQFAALSRDEKLQLIKPQLDLYVAAVSKKSEVLPIIATLAAALIVVATSNNDLVPLTRGETKFLLSFFLLLIPMTLHYYIEQMERSAKNSMEVIRSYHSDDPFKPLGCPSLLQQASSDFPILIVYTLYGIALLIIFRIWFG